METALAWQDPIIAYCERHDHGFWSEPLNALTNAAFLFSALAAWSLLRRQAQPDRPAMALILVTATVGVGSFVFHTFATRGAVLFDVIPIAVFIYAYFFLALRRFFELGVRASTAITALFATGSIVLDETVHGLNGSVGYVPALLAMLVFSALLAIPGLKRDTSHRQIAAGLALAAATFLISLILRTLDRDLCASIPVGTHFLWHLMNAVVLWLLLRTAILAKRAKIAPKARAE